MTKGNGKTYIFSLFFIFGISTMGWVGRFPELKAHLGLKNGQFGTVLSLGTIGGLISLLVVGHVVHRFGTLPVMLISSFSFQFLIGLMVHLTSVPLFILSNFLLGMAVAGFHISVNAQALHEQERLGEMIMPKAAGLWSAGSLLTVLISGALASHVSLVWHIDILEITSFLMMLVLFQKIRPYSLRANEFNDDETSIGRIFKDFHINWPISIGMLMGIQLEFSSGDWATIYSKEDLSFNAGVATIPYMCFVFSMILGRLLINKVSDRIPLEKLVKSGGIIGGAGFIIGLELSHYFRDRSPSIAFFSICFAFLIGGFGSSFLGPVFLIAANRASSSPGGVVVGHLGVTNSALTFLVKAIIAWTAQWLSLSVALLIPGVMLIAVSLFAKVVVKEPVSS